MDKDKLFPKQKLFFGRSDMCELLYGGATPGGKRHTLKQEMEKLIASYPEEKRAFIREYIEGKWTIITLGDLKEE